jgi:hypothetical protein
MKLPLVLKKWCLILTESDDNSKPAKKEESVLEIWRFGGLVCLRKCSNDVVDCSCESGGQSVYGPQIGFLEPFDPFRCKTNGSITSSHVAHSL